MSKIVRNYSIEKITPNLNVAVFKDKKVQENIKKLLSNNEEYVVRISLYNISSRVFNSIRRTIIDELEIKSLYFELLDVDTDNDFIIREELRDRVKYIPIDQSIPEGSTFELQVINNSPDKGIMTVYSNNIGGISDKVVSKIQIAELNHGEYIHIKNIKVVKGYGKDHSKWSRTCDLTWQNLDFMDVDYVNVKGNRLVKRVKVSDVAKLTKMKDELKLIDQRVLVIPNKDHESALDDREKSKIKIANYDHVIKTEIEQCFSTSHESNAIKMEFYLTGRFNPKKLLPDVCDNLIGRLTSIKNDIEKHPEIVKKDVILNQSMIETKTVIASDEKQTVWTLCVKNETHTIGEILKQQIFKLDKNITFIKKYIKNNGEYSFYIDMIHKNPKKITLDALDALIHIYAQIKREIL